MEFSRCVEARVRPNWYEETLGRNDFPALVQRAREVSDTINDCRVSAGLSYSDSRYQASFGTYSTSLFGILNGNPSYNALPSEDWHEYNESLRWYLAPTTLGDIFTRLLPVGGILGGAIGALSTYSRYTTGSTTLVTQGLRPLSFPLAALARTTVVGVGIGFLAFAAFSLDVYYGSPSGR